MMFWSLALAVTAIACAALYYAGAGRRVNANTAVPDTPEVEHLRLQLREIESDLAQGRLAAPEAEAARAEVARELLRLKAIPTRKAGDSLPWRGVVAGSLAVTVVVAGYTYHSLGSPDLPAKPLAERTEEVQAAETLSKMSPEQIVAAIEARIAQNPDDAQGWSLVAPFYMQLSRFDDAAKAFRKLIATNGPSAELEDNLGEALMMANKGVPNDEALALFRSAAARDPADIRSRYYIAGALTDKGDYEAATSAWKDLLALGKGDEAWVSAAQQGLAVAQNKGQAPTSTAEATSGGASDAIRGMVEGLSQRLAAQGGTIEEWTRLVRSRLVLEQVAEAQKAYDAARAAFPDPKQRTELDVLAADNGLVATR